MVISYMHHGKSQMYRFDQNKSCDFDRISPVKCLTRTKWNSYDCCYFLKKVCRSPLLPSQRTRTALTNTEQLRNLLSKFYTQIATHDKKEQLCTPNSQLRPTINGKINQ